MIKRLISLIRDVLSRSRSELRSLLCESPGYVWLCASRLDFAAPRKPTVRQIQIVMRNQNITPVLLNQRPATVHADAIRDQRAKHASERSRNAHQPQIETACVDQVAGKRHDYLGRQRDARG